MNEKYNKILTTALNLFYHSGIHATGINEIIASSGVSKKTMYRYFHSKESLIIETLKFRDQKFNRWMGNKLNDSSCGKENIINLFFGLNDWFNNRENILGTFRGCFFINTSAEYSQSNSEIFQVCQQHKQSVKQLIREQISKFTDDIEEVEKLTDILSIIKEGCISSALVQNDTEAALKALPTVKFLIDYKNSPR
jgi:AcrR family transcriptional regulator